VKQANLTVFMTDSRAALVSYRVSVLALHNLSTGSPLPIETNKDYLQMRCAVNGSPLKASSSVASTYFVLQNDEFTLSSSFVVDLPIGFSDLQLQWRKSGKSSSKWSIINPANFAQGQSMSISVIADYKQLQFVHEKKDAYLSESETWVDLTDTLDFQTERSSNVAVSYSLSVQPQLGAIIRGQNQETVSVRIIVDNVPYRDGSTVFGNFSTLVIIVQAFMLKSIFDLTQGPALGIHLRVVSSENCPWCCVRESIKQSCSGGALALYSAHGCLVHLFLLAMLVPGICLSLKKTSLPFKVLPRFNTSCPLIINGIR
jgi:hypothetical protein